MPGFLFAARYLKPSPPPRWPIYLALSFARCCLAIAARIGANGPYLCCRSLKPSA
jgi:hypothetical protein